MTQPNLLEVMYLEGNGLNPTFFASVDVTLLNCDLKGVYQYQILEKGKPEEDKQTTILVMPTDTEANGMTLPELIAEINTIINKFNGGKEVSTTEMEDTLESMGLKDINKIYVEMRQLFIYIKTSAKDPSKKTCEYAFNFVVKNKVEPDESLKIFNIKSLSLAVYNTNREKIIKRMELEDIDALLK